MLIEVNPSQQFLRDIIRTAVEGGIGYWAREIYSETYADGEGYVGGYLFAVIQEHEHAEQDGPGRFFTISPKSIELGIQRVLTPEFEVSSIIRGCIYNGLAGDDAGEIDAIAADVIVQAAMFGGVVYG